MVRRYESLFFDLDDTLWDTTANSRDSLSEAFVCCGLDRYFPSFEAFYRIYHSHNEQLWSDYAAGRIDKDTLNFERFAHPFRSAGIETGTATGFQALAPVGESTTEACAHATGRELLARFSALFFSLIPTKRKVLPHAHETLRLLQERGYRLFVLSNGFRELQSRKMQAAGLDGFFRRIVLSDDIGILKPNPRLFHFALSATQSDPRRSLMIGDNIRTDILGAFHAGLDQMYFNPRHLPIPTAAPAATSPTAPLLPEPPKGWKPTFEVHALAEIPLLLE